MEKTKQLPTRCPSCGAALRVAALHCADCDTRIEGDYPLSVILQLSAADRQFVLEFILCSGSLKEMAARQGLSYPTVRNRLDDIIRQIKSCTP